LEEEDVKRILLNCTETERWGEKYLCNKLLRKRVLINCTKAADFKTDLNIPVQNYVNGAR
jgi:hypothetical protein